ncbi:MAG: aldehyde dehydrogenase family protein [Thermoprotei archaeon]
MVNTDPATVKLFINGEERLSQDGSFFSSINPATGEPVSKTAKGTSEDAKAALDAAEDAYKSWCEVPAPQRAEILFKVGEMIRSRRLELARLLTQEEGKPLNEALGEIDEGYDITMYIAGEGRRLWSNVTTSEQTEKFAMVVRKPLGVVVAITPWNFPFSIPLWKIPPALVAGNTVVFKPASQTPLVAWAIVEMFIKAGVPRGVLNMVTGPGSVVGETLVNDPRVKVVALTGEAATGKRIAEVNARFLRKQVLELGGKNPLIVAKDAPMPVTVNAALFAAFSNAGQKCTAASRIIVEEPVLEQFVRKFSEAASKLKVGNGLDKGTEMGPVSSKNQLEKVRRYVEIGKSEGAKVLTGGFDYTDEARSRGYFYPPTVFGEVTNSMKIAQDEIFGPVTAIISAKNMDEAFELANDTRYGLSSAVFTSDVRTAFRSIFKLESGIGYVNQGPTAAEVHLPFGGVKDSGFGREAGEAAIDNYTEKKAVFVDFSYSKRSWYFPW